MRARLLVLIGSRSGCRRLIASAALAVDLFLFAKVTGRAPGTNDATVAVRWDFKCLGDKLGAADFEYTLVAVRVQAAPLEDDHDPLGHDEEGIDHVRLPAGTWQAQADPFLCETERGAGSTQPEVGQTVEVPDYCAWTVQRARGAVALETAASVKRARPGLGVAPGSTVVTPAGGQADHPDDRARCLGAPRRRHAPLDRCEAVLRTVWLAARARHG